MNWDTIFGVLAAVDLLCLVGIGVVAYQLLRQARSAAGLVAPARQHAQGTVGHGRRLFERARERGEENLRLARGVVALVNRRAETTRRLVRELRPAESEPDPRLVVREVASSVATKVTRGREWARRVGGLRRAAANAAGRRGDRAA